MKTHLLNIFALVVIALLVLLTISLKYEQATRNTWVAAEVLRTKQDCTAAGSVWVIHKDTAHCDPGHIGIPSK